MPIGPDRVFISPPPPPSTRNPTAARAAAATPPIASFMPPRIRVCVPPTRSPVWAPNVVSCIGDVCVTAGLGACVLARSGDDCTVNWLPPDAFSAPCTSAIAAKRSSGFLASIFITSASSATGISGRRERADTGATLRCMFTSSPNPSDTNGVWPISIS
jgi:hypothetical protein